jgi:hypothetical protein
MRDISHNAKGLETEIGRVISNITFDKIIRDKLMAITTELEGIIDDVRAKIPDHIYEHIDYTPDLDDMLKRYTMDSERLIHKDTAGVGGDGTEALLWDDSGNADGVHVQNDDGLGDNVELF